MDRLTAGPIKGEEILLLPDVYTHLRFIVGVHVRADESVVLAEEILGILRVVHADH